MPRDDSTRAHVPLTEAQYGAMMRALVAIAKGRKINQFGNSQRMCRDDLVTEAREACDAVGIKWQEIAA